MKAEGRRQKAKVRKRRQGAFFARRVYSLLPFALCLPGGRGMNFFEFVARNWREILSLTDEHLRLVAVSMAIAVAVGIPTGLLLTRHARWKRPVLAVANILQTIPSLALFAFLIPLRHVGIGWAPPVPPPLL